MASSPREDQCQVCKSTGLPLLPARYAVVPSAMSAPPLGPFSGEGVTDIEISENKYALRTLREGFLYLFYEQGPMGVNYWEVYAVKEDGSLWKQLDPASATAASADKQCSREGHNANRLQYIVIERPEQCGTVWVAFSEHKWSDNTIARYTEDGNPEPNALSAQDLRAQRMQAIEPANWIDAPAPGPHTQALTQSTIERIIEYSPDTQIGQWDEPIDPPYTPPARVSNRANDGSYRGNVLAACATRYPWCINNGPQDSQGRTPAAQVVEQVRRSAGAVGDAPPQSQPIVMALWDGIGIAHELNGFRNDPNARYLQYIDELELQFNGDQHIREAEAAVKAGVRQKRADRRERASAMPTAADRVIGPLGIAEARSNALSMAKPESRASVEAYYDDLEWMDNNRAPNHFVQQIRGLAQSTRAASYDAEEPYTGAARERIMAEARAWSQASAERASEREQQAQANTWADYTPHLETSKLNTFRTQSASLSTEVKRLQAQRTADVKHWLDAPVFIATLDDYDPYDFEDGLAYETVVSTALEGLNSEETGLAVLDTLIARYRVTRRDSFVWRAFALNRGDVLGLLEHAIITADQDKHTPLDEPDIPVNVIVSSGDKLKEFIGLFEKMENLSERSVPVNAADQILRQHGIDRLINTVGHRLFEMFRVESLGNFVGEGIIHTLFLCRAGVNSEDARRLVLAQAKVQPELRRRFLSEFQSGRTSGLEPPQALIAASGAIAETEGGRILHERWQALRAGADGGARLRMTVGLSTVVGIIELSNLIKTLSQADKGTEEYVQLTGSAFSVSAATAQLAYIPFEAINATNTAAGLKIASGYLGAVAAWVGSGLDFGSALKNLRLGETSIAWLYFVKAGFGFAAGSSYVLTALSASAPILERAAARLVGRQVELVFLGTVGRSVAAAEASAAARAAAFAAGESAEQARRRGAAAAAGILGERAGLMAVGRVLLFLGSWQIQVGLIGLQVFIWWLTDDALQKCLERSVFGTDPEYATTDKQDEEFNKALVDMGLKAEAAEDQSEE